MTSLRSAVSILAFAAMMPLAAFGQSPEQAAYDAALPEATTGAPIMGAPAAIPIAANTASTTAAAEAPVVDGSAAGEPAPVARTTASLPRLDPAPQSADPASTAAPAATAPAATTATAEPDPLAAASTSAQDRSHGAVARKVADINAPLQVEELKEAPAPVSSIDLTRQPTDLWDRIRAGFAMPDLHSPLVLDRQAWYASRPDLLKVMLARSRPYLFHIVEELEKRGMPTELALLPMVESAFNPMAYSRAQASGLWQFIPSTGKNYRLDQNWWYDGRRDIVASTAAALDYLHTIYDMTGDWYLALASYNWGENAVTREIERNRKAGRATDYLSLRMPRETRYYVPKLQALKNIVMNPAAFGIELDPIPNAPYFATVQLNHDIDLEQAARFAEMPIDELIALNPGHNRPVVDSAQAAPLVIPSDKLELFLANMAAHEDSLTSWQKYSAKRGERLDHIAAAFGTTVQKLREVNGIRGSGRLDAPAELLVPASPEAEIPVGLFKAPATIWAGPEAVRVFYRVRPKDTWSGIARRLGVRTADLMKWNRGAQLKVGHQLIAYRMETGRHAVRTARSAKVTKASAHRATAKRPSGTAVKSASASYGKKKAGPSIHG